MPRYDSTSWEVIQGAGRGDGRQREEFARRYAPIIREYLGARWRDTPMLPEVEDAADEVFLECFRLGGVLERADPARSGGFRAFFYGVVRNIARRFEGARARNREQQPSTSFDPAERKTPETSLSRVLDRAWARAILDEAGARYRKEAETQGEGAMRRVELLRLRFEEDLPIREIASRWNVDPDKVHQEYRRARREFRRFLEAELTFHEEDTEEGIERHWQEFLSLLQ